MLAYFHILCDRVYTVFSNINMILMYLNVFKIILDVAKQECTQRRDGSY